MHLQSGNEHCPLHDVVVDDDARYEHEANRSHVEVQVVFVAAVREEIAQILQTFQIADERLGTASKTLSCLVSTLSYRHVYITEPDILAAPLWTTRHENGQAAFISVSLKNEHPKVSFSPVSLTAEPQPNKRKTCETQKINKVFRVGKTFLNLSLTKKATPFRFD